MGDEVMMEQGVVAIGLLLVGIGVLALSVLLRVGAPRFLRGWMNPGVEDWMMERLVLLGLPLAGACLILAAGVAIPIGQPAVSVISLVGLVILVPAVVYLLIPLLPIPGILFPRWARDIRSRRAQMNAAFDARTRRDRPRSTR